MVKGIRDKVAIIGMGCTKFGERWESSAYDLMVEAFKECIADAGIAKEDIQAAWLGAFYESVHISRTAMPLSIALNLPHIPVSHVENACCTGTEALRGAAYAVASGACDIALALGVEKLKDCGYGGLPEETKGITADSLFQANLNGPSAFALLASSYRKKYNVSREDLKRAIAHVSWKSHQNGSKNPRAHLRNTPTIEQIINAPIVADPLGLYDSCGVSDGAACAIVTTPEIAKSLGKDNIITIKSLQIACSSAYETKFNEWDHTYFVTATKACQRAFEEAGVKNPREEISLLEVHDCFSITELILMEDLQMSDRGNAWKDILEGAFDIDGRNPCQVDGGLKCFGHPIGASGLRMIYENYNQLLGRCGERQLKNVNLGLTHNVGGGPEKSASGISIIGRLQ